MAIDVADRVRALALPLAEAAHADLIDVQVKGAGSRVHVRVVVDRKGGVDLATCQRLSQELSDALDADDPIEGRYVLEVSSPGVDRPLTDRASFDRVEGRLVEVHRRDDRPVRGTVAAAEPDAVVLDAGGEAVRVPYDDIVKATQALPW